MQVPVYNQQVTTQAAPSVRVPIGTPVEKAEQGFGQAVSNAGDQMAALGYQKQEQENTIAVQNQKTKFISDMNNVAYNPDGGLMYRQGQNAMGVNDTINNAAKGYIDTALESDDLKGNKARQNAFLRAVAGQQNAYNEVSAEHEYKQRQIAVKQSSDAAIEAATNGVVLNANQILTGTDAQGNKVDHPASDEFFRSAISSRFAYDTHIGMAPEAIQQDLKNLSTSIISTTVSTMLKNNDVAGANAVLNYYGKDATKMDAAEYSKLNAAVVKAAAPQRARQIADKIVSDAGGDTTKVLEGIRAYRDDPNYSMIRADALANVSDIKSIKAEQQKNLQNSILGKMWSFKTAAEQASYVTGLVGNGSLTPLEGASILSRANTIRTLLNKKDTELTERERQLKKAANYEASGGLAADKDNVQRYQDYVSQNPGEQVPFEIQKAADVSSTRIVNYWHVTEGFDPKKAADEDAQRWAVLQELQKQAEVLAERNKTKAYIKERIAPYLKQIGLDPEEASEKYFDWPKMGRNEGGVK